MGLNLHPLHAHKWTSTWAEASACPLPRTRSTDSIDGRIAPHPPKCGGECLRHEIPVSGLIHVAMDHVSPINLVQRKTALADLQPHRPEIHLE